ncbi:hypothetical protein A5636_14690 [Mycobacterium asiaticum]|uniref:HTH tetR-type domain-containing protein n=2 Tax=Mycobacterium asiaticum TaxID=1790 RepID=A0A1A3MM38_MYCAS|nr:hypothetical protein A5636_14690 [Mycobacterium asiaticum]
MYINMDTKSRRYEMRARKEATQATRDSIMAAALSVVAARRSLDVTLKAVAERAGVTVKTVLRHFGSREALIDATWAMARADTVAERAVPPGEPAQAIAALVEHYENRGAMVLGLLAEEHEEPRARLMCDDGRLLHREWVAQVFDAGLPTESPVRDRMIDALVVSTDVYCWKLLRLDRGLTVEDVCDRMQFMTGAVLTALQRTE